MESKIGKAIKLKSFPIAVFGTDTKPLNALQFREVRWGCVISMLDAAAKGRTAVFDTHSTTCVGGKTGLGFEKFDPGHIEYFLSTGNDAIEGEYYKKTPNWRARL